MKAPKVKLYVKQWKMERLVKKYGFRLCDASLREMKNGWLEVQVNWTAEKDSYLFKTCYSFGEMFSNDATSQSLRFTNLSKRFKHEIEIGIQLVNTKSKARIQYGIEYYRIEYYQNLKYGVAVYFAPKGWESNAKVIEDYGFDDKGIIISNKIVKVADEI